MSHRRIWLGTCHSVYLGWITATFGCFLINLQRIPQGYTPKSRILSHKYVHASPNTAGFLSIISVPIILSFALRESACLLTLLPILDIYPTF